MGIIQIRYRVCEKSNTKMVLYDEAMYPSGSAHGTVVKENSDYYARALGFIPLNEYKSEETDVIVAYCKSFDASHFLLFCN